MVQRRHRCLITLKALHLQPASISFSLIQNRTESKLLLCFRCSFSSLTSGFHVLEWFSKLSSRKVRKQTEAMSRLKKLCSRHPIRSSDRFAPQTKKKEESIPDNINYTFFVSLLPFHVLPTSITSGKNTHWKDKLGPCKCAFLCHKYSITPLINIILSTKIKSKSSPKTELTDRK